MSKLAIITRADNKVKQWLNQTHNIIKSYALKCNADFIILDETWNYKSYKHPYYRMFNTEKIFNNGYERILHLDTDVLLSNKLPNLFNIIDYNEIGGVIEDIGSVRCDRINEMEKIKKFFKLNIKWDENYLNEGVLLFSNIHQDIFRPINDKIYNGNFAPTQGHFNFSIKYNNYKTKNLGFKYNHMSIFSEKWNNYANRLNSLIIHYAGAGQFNNAQAKGLELLIKDKETYNFK